MNYSKCADKEGRQFYGKSHYYGVPEIKVSLFQAIYKLLLVICFLLYNTDGKILDIWNGFDAAEEENYLIMKTIQTI